MGILELMLTAIGLAMDAFAASLCTGLRMKRIDYSHALLAAGMFGFAQGAMPLLGWALGVQFKEYITSIDHWLAFGMLSIIGVRMVMEARKDDGPASQGFTVRELSTLAVATSIDALAVGVTFAFLDVDILPSSILICAVTFMLCFMGVCIGCRFGKALKARAEIAGGIVLVLIGFKILLEHLHYL